MENDIPAWAEELAEAVSNSIEFKGLASLEVIYSASEDNTWGVDLIEMAPALLEIDEAGANDGEEVFGVIHSFDLLDAQEAFDKVTGLLFGIEDNGESTITLEGEVDGQEVVLIIHTEPFADAEPNGKIDLLDGQNPHLEFYDDEEDEEDFSDEDDEDLP